MIAVGAPYRDREAAGTVLAQKLQALNLEGENLVLAIPNGGVAVAVPIARKLNAELDLLIVRKLQIPYNPEAGFGALTSLGTVILNESLITRIGLDNNQIKLVIKKTRTQIEDRKRTYAGLAGWASPKNRSVIVVDDGLASGYTMLAAIQSIRDLSPRQVIVAVPTASAGAVSRIREVADSLICPHTGSAFVFAVADAYQNWYDVPDDEVIKQLRRFRKRA